MSRIRRAVSVCPIACIHVDAGKDRKLYIDPQECIDCGACEPACPVEAIYAEFDLLSQWAPNEVIDALWYREAAALVILDIMNARA
jgi:NAD-dependent dihydropyrimidine dehydrogenase PreA subunit